jgi:hypothetical protein
MVRKWPTSSLKVQACNIRKTAKLNNQPIPTDEEIYQIFVRQGKLTPTKTPNPPANPPGSLASPGVSFAKIDEETYQQYLLLCMNGQGDIRVCTEIRNYLDKTQALQPKARTTLPLLSEDEYPEFSDSDTAVCP